MTVLEFKKDLKEHVQTLRNIVNDERMDMDAVSQLGDKIFGQIGDEPPEDKELARIQAFLMGMLVGEAIFRGINLDNENLRTPEAFQIFSQTCDQVIKNLDTLGVW
jgi:hypothetical protein